MRLSPRLTALLLGLVAIPFVAEIATRLLAPQALISDILVADPDIDYRLRPHARGRMTSADYAVDVRVNALGFRGEEFPFTKRPGTTRVLFLGNGYTFGHGLRDADALPHVVGQELERRDPGRYAVINGGVYGYTTANELEFFLKYGRPLQPDIVVILVTTGDMYDNTAWYELSADGTLRRKPTTSQYAYTRRLTRYVPGAGWLREHSHLFKFAGLLFLPSRIRGATQAEVVRHKELFPPFYRTKRGPFAVTTALLAKLAEAARPGGTRLVLLTVGPADGAGLYVASDLILPHERLIDATVRKGFSTAMPLSPILWRVDDKKKLFFPNDGHWTPAATRLLAPPVADVITRVAAR